MEYAIAIRTEIRKCMQKKGYNLSNFAKESTITSSHLSSLLSERPSRPLSVHQLDRINFTLNNPEGCFYELYVDECFLSGKPHRSRVKPFLLRCAELDKKNCIEQVLSRMMEDLNYISLVFEVAEELHAKGNIRKSLVFYECVAEHERYQHSERLAISQYRLFRAALGKDLEKNRDAVTRFSPFRNRLPVNYQLDGLLQLGNIYFSLNDWKQLGESADELIALAKIVYQEQQQRTTSKGKKSSLKTERHLVVYYGKGYLMRAVAYEKQGLYEESKKYIKGYADLSWFKGLDENATNDVENFKMFAIANSYTLDMLMGHVHILQEYTQYLLDHPQEILTGLVVIIEAANKYGFAIEETLAKLSKKMVEEERRDEIISKGGWYLKFHYQLAVYLLRNGQTENGADSIFEMLESSILCNDFSLFIQGISLFESCKDKVSDSQQNKYRNLLERIKEHESFDLSHRNYIALLLLGLDKTRSHFSEIL
ncbi:DNA-binding protein [Paenibacillus terrae]|uniref:DNA-binding protein n=1 Tax=Paenibacillus terrae TaxID=159743 RepID=A0A4U2PTK2_9BACL|nr:helix-turn-helix domain-containing protein [Paenibacillus terrae]TKH43052.1 DNA-binding protein [Paenibacillus terrae]